MWSQIFGPQTDLIKWLWLYHCTKRKGRNEMGLSQRNVTVLSLSETLQLSLFFYQQNKLNKFKVQPYSKAYFKACSMFCTILYLGKKNTTLTPQHCPCYKKSLPFIHFVMFHFLCFKNCQKWFKNKHFLTFLNGNFRAFIHFHVSVCKMKKMVEAKLRIVLCKNGCDKYKLG